MEPKDIETATVIGMVTTTATVQDTTMDPIKSIRMRRSDKPLIVK